jgi:pilus assembly protein CpaB
MNRRFVNLLVLAFVIALACTIFVWKKLTAGAAGAPQKSNTVAVVAAAENIKLGSVLTAGNLTTVQIAGTLPVGAIRDTKNAIGRGVISDLYQGEPIEEYRLAAVGSGGGLAATIPNGMRVCAIKVDEVVGVSGFVTPGMRVDVLVSGSPPGAQGASQGSMVKTILQNIEVKSAGTDIQKDAEGKPQQVQVVNLLVTPVQAEVLSLAASQMRIQLVLRNPLDTKIAQVPGDAMANLFSGAPAVEKTSSAPSMQRGVVKKPAPAFITVEVLNGTTRTTEKFSVPEGKQ